MSSHGSVHWTSRVISPPYPIAACELGKKTQPLRTELTKELRGCSTGVYERARFWQPGRRLSCLELACHTSTMHIVGGQCCL